MDEVEKWRMRFERERLARQEAEALLEAKSRDLYLVNQELAREVQERKRLNDQTIRIYRDLFEQSRDGIILYDLQGAIVDLNAQMLQLLGCGREEILGQNWGAFHLDADAPAYQQSLEAVRGSDEFRYEVRLRTKDGPPFFAEIVVGKLDNGTQLLVQGFVRDITQRHEANQRLLQSNEALKQTMEELKRASEAKTVFLSTMSHELRTPLNGLIGFTQLLIDTRLQPDQLEYVSTIRSSAQALTKIIGDILDVSKIESGKFSIEKEPFRPVECIRSAISMLSSTAREKRISLLFQPPTNLEHLVIHNDPNRLRQVLLNLINNALKFTDIGSITVTVHLDDPGQTLIFGVRDTGAGIAPEDLPLLFEPFAQTRNRILTQAHGTGLGLSISRQLILLMGGEITCESELGRGTLFRFTLPNAITIHAAPTVREGGALPVIASDRPVLKILLADDHPVNLRLLEIGLQKLGHHIYKAMNGQEAVDLAKEHHPDVLFLDLQMPMMNGMEVAQALRADPAHDRLNIIGVTGHTNPEIFADCLKAGMDHCLSKPVYLPMLQQYLHPRTPPGPPHVT